MLINKMMWFDVDTTVEKHEKSSHFNLNFYWPTSKIIFQ